MHTHMHVCTVCTHTPIHISWGIQLHIETERHAYIFYQFKESRVHRVAFSTKTSWGGVDITFTSHHPTRTGQTCCTLPSSLRMLINTKDETWLCNLAIVWDDCQELATYKHEKIQVILTAPDTRKIISFPPQCRFTFNQSCWDVKRKKKKIHLISILHNNQTFSFLGNNLYVRSM